MKTCSNETCTQVNPQPLYQFSEYSYCTTCEQDRRKWVTALVAEIQAKREARWEKELREEAARERDRAARDAWLKTRK